MARPKSNPLRERLMEMRDAVRVSAADVAPRPIPSIIEFCEGEDWLGLPYMANPIFLRPMQKLILKAFYRGSEGNEFLTFTDEELEYMKECGLDSPDHGDVIGKIDNNKIFRELVLVWGRRAGKDFLCSIIALYEAMRLLEAPNGCPYAKYGIPRGGNPITILTIATAAAQAEVAFNEIKSKLLASKYFKDKFIADGLTARAIHLLTPVDRLENDDRRSRGLPLDKGGIVIRAGHSNSDSMLGMQCFVLLLDEVASFKTTEGSSGGRRIYEAMLPSLNTFVRNELDAEGNPIVDEHGNHIKVFDSKVVSISSPRGKEGILWEMFKNADEVDDRLACRLPTWVVNTDLTRESLRKTFSNFPEDRFMMEFGADFVGSGSLNFFTEDQIAGVMDHTLSLNSRGRHGIVYFAHLDPALSNHNYVLAICHKELFINTETKKAESLVFLDHLKIWTPMPNKPIMIEEVDSYVIKMNLAYHIGLMTYDDYHSMSSIQKMRKAGIPCKLTKYNRHYKMLIYTELEKLINERRIRLPYHNLLEAELTNLQRRYDGGRGWSVKPNRESETPTDDTCDALAGAVYNCMGSSVQGLPLSKLVSLSPNPQSSQMQWMSMQGVPLGSRPGSSPYNHLLGGGR